MPNFARVRAGRAWTSVPQMSDPMPECPVRLRDATGHIWMGEARTEQGQVLYRFRDPQGAVITGVANGGRIVLIDDKGVTWQGSLS